MELKKLYYKLTGTENPRYLTEEQKLVIDDCLKIINEIEQSHGAEGATVGNSAAGKGVRKRLRKCEKLGYKRCSMEGSFGCCVG